MTAKSGRHGQAVRGGYDRGSGLHHQGEVILLTKYYFSIKVILMKLTIKGQVTIPKRLRKRYGLNPQEEVIIEEAPGGVLIRVTKRIFSSLALVQRKEAGAWD